MVSEFSLVSCGGVHNGYLRVAVRMAGWRLILPMTVLTLEDVEGRERSSNDVGCAWPSGTLRRFRRVGQFTTNQATMAVLGALAVPAALFRVSLTVPALVLGTAATT